MMTKSSNRTANKPLDKNHKKSHTCVAHGNHTHKKDNKDTTQPSCFFSSPPSTDPDEIRKLWARVKFNTQQMPQTVEAKEKVAGEATANYRIQELEMRRITIVQTSARPWTWVFRHAPTASQAEHLVGLYVPFEDDEYINTVRMWAKAHLNVNNLALPEFQWTADVYLRFLRSRNKPHHEDEEQDTIKLERNLQPWVSLKQNEDILLPPKEALPADDFSAAADADSASKGQQTAMRPDIMYASNLTLLDDMGMYWNHPAMRTFAAINQLPPYMIGEFKSTLGQAVEAQQSLALLGAMMLLERVKLRRMSPNPALDDIHIFMITCCGPQVDIYCMVIRTTGHRCLAGELLSYDMNRCSTYILTHKSDIKRLGEDLNHIHIYGQTTHLDQIKRDLAAATASVSLLADLDKRSYQYNGRNGLPQGINW